MSATHLSGYGLRRALVAGIQRVIAGRDEINRINVWPVADQDTGTNLACTLGAVLQGLREAGPAGAARVLQRVAAESADSAKGNAGAILAQFFHGAAAVPAAGARLTTASLAEAAARGLALARTAMAAPCEGTILTVMRAFAEELQRQAGTADLRAGFARALARSQEALRQTRRQIPALRAAGVVDAGAQGFVRLLEGIAEYIERGRAVPVGAIPAELVAAGVDTSRPGPGSQRHSVECVISAGNVDRAGLKTALLVLPLTDQVITGTRDQVRLHARVDDPAAFFALAARFGAVSRERTGDRSRPAVAIATDSGADFPTEEMARLDIHLVPQRLSVDGRDHVDRLSITPHELYESMRTSPIPPRTSQPPPGDFRRLFEHLLAHHESVVEVSLARTLSGTLQAAESAAARTGPGRVHVFDTGSVSNGQGLLTLWAAEAAQAGHDARSILAGLERMRPRTKVYAVVRDIRYAVRGGRVPRAALTLTRLLRLSLTLKIRPNGRLGLGGALWGRRHLPERFARTVIRGLDPARRYRVIIGHCDCADDARRVEAVLRTSGLDLDRVWIVETGAAIGAHAGPGSLVIGVQDYEAPSP